MTHSDASNSVPCVDKLYSSTHYQILKLKEWTSICLKLYMFFLYSYICCICVGISDTHCIPLIHDGIHSLYTLYISLYTLQGTYGDQLWFGTESRDFLSRRHNSLKGLKETVGPARAIEMLCLNTRFSKTRAQKRVPKVIHQIMSKKLHFKLFFQSIFYYFISNKVKWSNVSIFIHLVYHSNSPNSVEKNYTLNFFFRLFFITSLLMSKVMLQYFLMDILLHSILYSIIWYC